MENWFVPYQVSELPKARHALVLAPHPDDEIFGCAGAVALLRQQGTLVDVLVLTDGAGWAVDAQRQTVVRTRQAETQAALALLRLAPAQFLGLADRSLAADASLDQQIANRLQGVDLVFAPSLTEVHPDHVATGRAALSAARRLIDQGRQAPDILFYEVGTALIPNFLLDITSVWGEKKQAMDCFQSQQTAQDYARHIEGLNAFRTYSLPTHVKYAEAYCLVLSDKVKSYQESDLIPTRLHRRDVHSIEHILQEAEATTETLNSQLIKANRTVLESRERIRELSETSDELQAALAQQNDRYARDVAELHAAIHALKQAHQSLLNSRSWRLTRPLRWLGDKLNRRT